MTLISNQCSVHSWCAEHYWIMGRIYEELDDSNKSIEWLRKAVENTSTKHSEYENRVWNLVWMLNKKVNSTAAIQSSRLYLSKLATKDISSKFYYWMSEWSDDEDEKNKYKSLLIKHHPLSFYLWSDLALGQGLELQIDSKKKFEKSFDQKCEEDLYKIINTHEVSLAHNFINFCERKKLAKKTITWKKLKALSGKYADLQLDLEAGNIDAKSNLPYFFSQGFDEQISNASQKFSIPKEILWSIIRQESNFNPYARSWADAFGLMQILPSRAVNFYNSIKEKNKPEIKDINPFKLYDTTLNTLVGAWLIRENLKTFNGKLPLAIAAYNASESKVKEWEKRFYNADNWMTLIEEITYRETRNYVKLVLRNKAIYEKLEEINSTK